MVGPQFFHRFIQRMGGEAAHIHASHDTYIHNGDLMRDPEMTFRVDRDKGTLEPLTFQQDGSIQVYQQVYPEPGRWVPKLRSDLNHFAPLPSKRARSRSELAQAF